MIGHELRFNKDLALIIPGDYILPKAAKIKTNYTNTIEILENENHNITKPIYNHVIFTILLGIRVVNVQSNGHPPERKPVIMRRKHVWFVERMWVENPTTIQTRISKETKRFSRMVIGFPVVDLL